MHPTAAWGIALLLAALGLSSGAAGRVLENEHVRIEVDPQTFSVRYLGWPGGPNFVSPIYLTPRERMEPGLV